MMTAFEWIMIFVMSWWMVFLVVLPYGSQVPEVAEKNHYHSAPKSVRLARKLLVTTVIAIVVTALIAGVIQSGWISIT